MLLHREIPHLKERYLIEGLHDVWIFHTEKSSNIKESLAVGNLIVSFHLMEKTFQYNCLIAMRIPEMTLTYRQPQLLASFSSMTPYFLLLIVNNVTQ